MAGSFSPSPWKAINKLGSWQILGENGIKIAVIEQSRNSEKNAKLISASPYMLEEAKVLINQWRKEYNQIRPHSSKNYQPPAPEAKLLPVLT